MPTVMSCAGPQLDSKCTCAPDAAVSGSGPFTTSRSKSAVPAHGMQPARPASIIEPASGFIVEQPGCIAQCVASSDSHGEVVPPQDIVVDQTQPVWCPHGSIAVNVLHAFAVPVHVAPVHVQPISAWQAVMVPLL